jgi:hypothetical protein
MNSILFTNHKPTNGKKGKSHKMYVFAQDIRIRNSVRVGPRGHMQAPSAPTQCGCSSRLREQEK